MNGQASNVEIDVGQVAPAAELHQLLRDSLGFPMWYGCNWDAFWDAMTVLVQMPMFLRIIGWKSFLLRMPRDAQLIQECFAHMAAEYPDPAPRVELA